MFFFVVSSCLGSRANLMHSSRYLRVISEYSYYFKIACTLPFANDLEYSIQTNVCSDSGIENLS